MRCVFSVIIKMSTDSDSWMDLGSLFHKWGAADANALYPHVHLDFGMAKEYCTKWIWNLERTVGGIGHEMCLIQVNPFTQAGNVG